MIRFRKQRNLATLWSLILLLLSRRHQALAKRLMGCGKLLNQFVQLSLSTRPWNSAVDWLSLLNGALYSREVTGGYHNSIHNPCLVPASLQVK